VSSVAWRSIRLVVCILLISCAAFGLPKPPAARGALAVVAVPDTLSMRHDRTAVVAAPGVLGNDLNLLGGTTAILVSASSHGSVNLQGNGGYTYAPNAGYVGTDVYSYRPSGLLSNTTTVTITITNAVPVAVANSYTATAGVPLQVAAPGVLANDTDADGDALNADLLTGVSHGSLSFSTSGGFTYTPSSGYSGADAFTYRAGDGISWSVSTTVWLIVSSPTPSPTPTPTPRPTPTPTASPPSATASPTSPMPSLPAPSQPLPSTPEPSLPIPSLGVPMPTNAPSPGATLPLPSLPLPSPSSSSAASQPRSSASGGSGPASSSGSGAGGGDSTTGGRESNAGGPKPSVVIGPAGLGVRIGSVGSGGLALGDVGSLSLQLWLVPGAVVAGPGLLVLLWLAIQVIAGMIWLPAARRVRGQEERRRRRASAAN
jgi:Bacterial Ig domain